MTAVDANILVYSQRMDSPWYRQAEDAIRELAESRTPWAIPWPCVYEFLNTVTHPRRYEPPTPVPMALTVVESWLASPSLVLLSEPMGFFATLRDVIRSTRVAGPAVHDARIAALCHYHGVDKLYTADRDFSRFARYVRVENPLVAPRG